MTYDWATTVDIDCFSTKKRCWAFSVLLCCNIKFGKHLLDGKDTAYCKYCNGSPIDEDSSNGTFNFICHTESYSAHWSTDVGSNNVR